MEKLNVSILILFALVTVGQSLRYVRYQVEFSDDCPADPNGSGAGRTVVLVETGSTALDVMTAAADKNREFNFEATYFGDTGYFITAIRGTAAAGNCFWSFNYIIPGVAGEIRAAVGVSNLIVPGDGWQIIMRLISFQAGDS